MRKNPHGRIFREELKEQHLSIVPEFYSLIYSNYTIFSPL